MAIPNVPAAAAVEQSAAATPKESNSTTSLGSYPAVVESPGRQELPKEVRTLIAAPNGSDAKLKQDTLHS